MKVVYLDANVYDRAVKQKWAGTLLPTSKTERVLIAGSVELLIEALRCPDHAIRRRVVQLTVTSTSVRLAPALKRATSEVVAEIRRLRPGWIRRPADTSGPQEALRRAKSVWRKLLLNPSFVPTGIPTNDALMRQLEIAGREGQKTRRALRRHGIEPDVESALGTARAELEAAVKAMSPAERHWRVIGGALWWDALQGDPGIRDMRTWLSGQVKPPAQISREDWMKFWCQEVDPTRVPTFVIYMLAEYHQTDLGIELNKSNGMDAIHASYLLDVDAVVSRDPNFLKVLDAVRVDAPISFAKGVQFDDAVKPPTSALSQALSAARSP